MPPTLPEPSPFVGRQREREAYQHLLRGERSPWILVISGQGGNGKSALLRQLRAETPAELRVGLLDFAIPALRLDPLRVVEAVAEILRPLTHEADYTQFHQVYDQGWSRLAQMPIILQQQMTIGTGSQAQDLSQSIDTAGVVNEIRRQAQEQVTDALLQLANRMHGKQLTLMLDTCEWFNEPGSQEVGIWLVKDLLPRLRDRLAGNLRVVAAGREPFTTLDQSDEVRVLPPLRLLSPTELDDYLQQVGMQEAGLRQAVYEMTRGHPLCASIVADLWRERPFGSADLPAFQGQFSERAMMEWVQERILDMRMQPPYDDLVRYGVLLRSFDLPLLRQVFPEWLDPGDQVFQHLIRYSFVIRLTDGRYAFHDLLRHVQGSYVRRQLPDRWQHYHERALQAWQQHPEQIFGQAVPPPDYYYHLLALDEQTGMQEWRTTFHQPTIVGERGYWNDVLQVPYDGTLELSKESQAKVLYEQGFFYFFNEQWELALASLEKAYQLSAQLDQPFRQAAELCSIGIVQVMLGQTAKALESFQQAQPLFQRAKSVAGEATALQMLGLIHVLSGNQEAAEASFANARRILEQEGAKVEGPEAYLLQAFVAPIPFPFQRLQPDAYPEALQSYTNAYLASEQEGDIFLQAFMLLLRSALYEGMGENLLAGQDAEAALSIAQRFKLPFLDLFRWHLDELP